MKSMETIGAYAFITSDWKEKDFPLDLWLEHHLKIFDQIALITYGEIKINPHPKLKVNEVSPVSENKFSFYIIGKTEAQKLLDTDWKILLDVDEFIFSPPDTSLLNKKLAYALRYHHLYGNIYTEIDNEFPKFQYRLHYGNRKILGDGANVEGPIAARCQSSIANLIRAAIKKPLRMFIPSVDKYLHSNPVFVPHTCFEVWHTGAARNPKALSNKWRVQIEREKSEGITYGIDHIKWLNGGGFDYASFKNIWPNSRIFNVAPEKLPEVLRKNSNRFNWVLFGPNEYSKTQEPRSCLK